MKVFWKTEYHRKVGFSLIEVVIAVGVIAFAIVAIIGVVPVALQAGHRGQDETRTTQIAQSIIDSMAAQAQTSFDNISLPVSPSPPPIDLSSSNTTATSPAAFIYATNDGVLSSSSTNATYSISVITNDFSSTASPVPFDPQYANQVTLRIVSPPLPSAASTPRSNQTVRDYVRVISKY